MNKYAFREYSSEYPRLFQIERERIEHALRVPALVEHIGSTAVVGLGGKGILDIGIGVAPQDRLAGREQLSQAGYEYRAKASTDSRDFLRADYFDGRDVSRVHIHMLGWSEPEWTQLLRFRDYLRHHPTIAREYADSKMRAAREADGNGSKYKALKETVLQKVIQLAQQEQADGREI